MEKLAIIGERFYPTLLTESEIEESSRNDQVQMLAGTSILVTGGSGMIGSAFLEKLVFGLRENGRRPKALDILTRHPDNPNLRGIQNMLGVEIRVGDLAAFEASRNYDFVLHAASPASPTQFGDGTAVRQSNSGFAERLIAQREKFGRVLFVSSGEVYGSAAPVPVSEEYVGSFSSNDGRMVYPQQKLLTEQMLLSELRNCVVGRLFHSFGPGLRKGDGRSFADFIWAGANGDSICLRSDGRDVRTFLFSGDATDAFFALLGSQSDQSVFNVGSDEPMSIREFASSVAALAGVPIEFSASEDDDYVHSPNRAIVPLTTRLRSIGWRPQVAVGEAIERTLAWAKSHGRSISLPQ